MNPSQTGLVMGDNSTIIAIATPAGIGALAVIRISGFNSYKIVSKSIFDKKKFETTPARKITLHRIINSDTDETIDEVTIVKYPAPNSFTGEEMVEIICHGGPYIVKSLVEELIKNGGRGAQKGEFTKRAFLNGKIDLMKAEAIKGMIECTNEIESKSAIKALNGEYVEILKMWKSELTAILAEIEADIEFGEEHDVEIRKDSTSGIKRIEKRIEEEIRKREIFKWYENGIKIVIAGPSNAGKSTLFNLLIGYDRAITNEEPGTTRDWISENIIIDKSEVLIVDSAGIRETENQVEIAGIKKSRQEIEKANIVIWVTPANEDLSPEENMWLERLDGESTIFVLNKMDLPGNIAKINTFKNSNKYYEQVCLRTTGAAQIETEKIKRSIKRIIQKIKNQIELPDVINNKRQEDVAREILYQIKKAQNEWGSQEIAAYHINIALEQMEEFTGKRDREDVLNRIFETFCIGK